MAAEAAPTTSTSAGPTSTSPFIAPTEPRTWHRDGFIITTDRSLVSIPSLTRAFASEALHWTNAYPEDVMQAIIDNSCCFTLFATDKQIGFARGVTDYVTFFYLTDVYVESQWQGEGMGSWLIECVQEFVEQMPYLRRSMLISSQAKGLDFYARRMKMHKVGANEEERGIVMCWKGPGSLI